MCSRCRFPVNVAVTPSCPRGLRSPTSWYELCAGDACFAELPSCWMAALAFKSTCQLMKIICAQEPVRLPIAEGCGRGPKGCSVPCRAQAVQNARRAEGIRQAHAQCGDTAAGGSRDCNPRTARPHQHCQAGETTATLEVCRRLACKPTLCSGIRSAQSWLCVCAVRRV